MRAQLSSPAGPPAPGQAPVTLNRRAVPTRPGGDA